MKYLWALAIAITLICCTADKTLFAQNVTPELSGAARVEQGEHPWTAYINAGGVYTKGFQFEGVLISNEWIMTCGHCLMNGSTPYETRVHLGGIDKFALEEGEIVVHGIEFVYLNFLSDTNDDPLEIGLLRISPIIPTSSIRPIDLYTKTQGIENAVVITSTLVGWGETADESLNERYLQSAIAHFICRMNGLADMKCQDPYNPNIGICVGNSGSTLEILDEGLPKLLAIGWGGNDCDAERRFSSFTRVAPIADLIYSAISKQRLKLFVPFLER